MKNIESNPNPGAHLSHVCLPSFTSGSAHQKERDSPSVPRLRSLSASSASACQGNSQRSIHGGYLNSLQGSHLSSIPPSSQGIKSKNGGSCTASSRDSHAPHRAGPAAVHSMSIGNLLSSSASITSSALPTPTPLGFLGGSPPSARSVNGRSGGVNRMSTRDGFVLEGLESSERREQRALSNSLSWIAPRHRSQSIAPRGSSFHSCEGVHPQRVVPRSPSTIARMGPVPPLVDEPDALGGSSFFSAPHGHRLSLFSHPGWPYRHTGITSRGSVDSLNGTSLMEDEATAISEFTKEAHEIPESLLSSAVDNLKQKVLILETEVIRERRVVQEMSENISQSFNNTEKSQELTTNRIIRYLRKLQQKKLNLQKHLKEVQENKQEQERKLANVKRNIEKLKEYLKCEEDVISQRIKRRICAMQSKCLALEEDLQNESYSVHHLEQLVNEFQNLDAPSGVGSGGSPSFSDGSSAGGGRLTSGQVERTMSSSVSLVPGGGGGGESITPSCSRKSSIFSAGNSQSSQSPAHVLAVKGHPDTSVRCSGNPTALEKSVPRSPCLPTQEGDEERAQKSFSSPSAEPSPGDPASSPSLYTSMNVPLGTRESTYPGGWWATQDTLAEKRQRHSSELLQLASRSGSQSSRSSIIPSPSTSAAEVSLTGVLQTSPDQNMAAPNNRKNSSQDAVSTKSKTGTPSQIASIIFLEKAIRVLSHLKMDAVHQQNYCRSRIQDLRKRVDDELRVKQDELDALQHIQRELIERTRQQPMHSSVQLPQDSEDDYGSPNSSKNMPVSPFPQSVMKCISYTAKEREDSRDSTSGRGGRGRNTMGLGVTRPGPRQRRGGTGMQVESRSLFESEDEGGSHLAPYPYTLPHQGHLWTGADNMRHTGFGVPSGTNLGGRDEKVHLPVRTDDHHITPKSSSICDPGACGGEAMPSPLQIVLPSDDSASNSRTTTSETPDCTAPSSVGE